MANQFNFIFFLFILLNIFCCILAYYESAGIENIGRYNCDQYSAKEESKRKSNDNNDASSERQKTQTKDQEAVDQDQDNEITEEELSDYDDFNKYQNAKNSDQDNSFSSDQSTQFVNKLNKRESPKLNDQDNLNLAEIATMSDAEIETVLSKFKMSDLQLLDKLIDNDEENSYKTKREVLRLKTQKSNNFNENDGIKRAKLIAIKGYSKDKMMDTKDENLKRSNAKRATSHQHQHHRTDSERINSQIDAKINFFRDQSAIQKLTSRSLKNRQEKRAVDDFRENPYFNSMIGPRARTKRSNENEQLSKAEHIRLLEESFPNPIVSDDINSNEPHIRVKRDGNGN